MPQAVLEVDGQLRSHEPHLRYRMTQYEETKRAIEDVEGSVADFARVRVLTATCACVRGTSQAVASGSPGSLVTRVCACLASRNYLLSSRQTPTSLPMCSRP